ncbi:eukaryotic translation initiation factor 4E-1 [Galendromus occidentalis]|uniref:Eukaryotic translation initiation factor 4E-1 n=1 Tax=Galendromus occidentalis TaxID=34638 RepID=A0AAJ6QN75_9ACAR|nr:eukaryotic translation initiation factor 4E-1-like [Galendromus occidentalis]XP_003738474.1 eukaryotic translation initiation factor 4E-1-like [Galendromus occidentalis]XP_003744543.1 eukaryotic translation initiation factor 4E-1 [Galendromus occidentalis]
MGNEDDKKFTVWRFTDKPLRLSWVDHLEELYTGSPDGVLDFCGQLGPPSKLKSETSLHRDFCVFRYDAVPMWEDAHISNMKLRLTLQGDAEIDAVWWRSLMLLLSAKSDLAMVSGLCLQIRKKFTVSFWLYGEHVMKAAEKPEKQIILDIAQCWKMALGISDGAIEVSRRSPRGYRKAFTALVWRSV